MRGDRSNLETCSCFQGQRIISSRVRAGIPASLTALPERRFQNKGLFSNRVQTYKEDAPVATTNQSLQTGEVRKAWPPDKKLLTEDVVNMLDGC